MARTSVVVMALAVGLAVCIPVCGQTIVEDFEDGGVGGFDPAFNHEFISMSPPDPAQWEIIDFGSTGDFELGIYGGTTDEVTFKLGPGEYVDWASATLVDYDPGGSITGVEFVGTMGSVTFPAVGVSVEETYDTTGQGLGEIQMIRVKSYEGAFDNLTINVMQRPEMPSLDIKPGSCPNPVNPKSQGVVPAAVVGTDSFDVMQIDFDSLELMRADGVGGAVTPRVRDHGHSYSIEDVATPFEGDLCECHEYVGDGIEDMGIKFSTPELAEAFELDSVGPRTPIVLTLRGTLMDGTPFEVSDCIIVPGRSNERGDTRGLKRGKHR